MTHFGVMDLAGGAIPPGLVPVPDKLFFASTSDLNAYWHTTVLAG